MAWNFSFVLIAACALMASTVSTAPSKTDIKPRNEELREAIEEYRVRFDELHKEKDQFLQFARTGLWATVRRMNEEVLVDLGETRNIVEYGFDDVRLDISLLIVEGNHDEQCLLNLVYDIVDEKVRLGEEISRCSAGTTDTKDSLPASFYEFLNLLQRLSNSIAETTLYTFVSQNSVADPERHLEFLQESFAETDRAWNEEALPLVQFELDAMEYNRPLIVADNAECLQEIQNSQQAFEDSIRQRISSCL
uniref:Protein TsetseEP domain-containing protein n=1 Tax=Anopheles culicifacies TaxID=139723 RepID=A0A182MAQ5_9DIPT